MGCCECKSDQVDRKPIEVNTIPKYDPFAEYDEISLMNLVPSHQQYYLLDRTYSY